MSETVSANSHPDRADRRGPFIFVGCSTIILAGLSILAAEVAEDPQLAGAKYTIWLTYALLMLAFVFYLWPGDREVLERYFRVTWLSGFGVYALHVYYTFFGMFKGSAGVFFEEQGLVIASMNTLLTLWWTLDAVAMLFRVSAPWIRIERVILMILLFAAAFYVGVFRRPGPAAIISIVMALAVAGAFIQRIPARLRKDT